MNATDKKNMEKLTDFVVSGTIRKIDFRISSTHVETSFEVYRSSPVIEVHNFLTEKQKSSDDNTIFLAGAQPFFTLAGAVALAEYIEAKELTGVAR